MRDKELEKIYKAVANKRRIAILMHLYRQDFASVGEIAEKIKLSFRATSRHLSVLAGSELLDKEQSGLSMLYYIPKAKRQRVAKLLAI